MNATLQQIGAHIQQRLAQRSEREVTAVDAARWLDDAGLLKDSPTWRGKPLRDLLRKGLIVGQRQEPNRRWFIDRVSP